MIKKIASSKNIHTCIVHTIMVYSPGFVSLLEQFKKN